MTTAVVPFKAQEVVIPPGSRPLIVKSTKAQRRADRAAMIDRVVERTAMTVLDAIEQLVRFPPMLILGTCAATNLASQTQTGTYQGRPTYLIEGAVSASLQSILVTQAALTTVSEAVKPATDIVSLIKLIRTGIG